MLLSYGLHVWNKTDDNDDDDTKNRVSTALW